MAEIRGNPAEVQRPPNSGVLALERAMEKKTPPGGDLRRRMIQQQKLFYVIEMLQFVFGDLKDHRQ